MGEDGITEVTEVAPAIVEPKSPGKAAEVAKETAEVAVEVELEHVMIGSEFGR